ncbi:MAG: lipoyl synthase [Burkholderiales bacterium]|nr:lipoyl synthase [Burkholderiales bacterium]OUT75983.1 MAG: lipoyl synthase [Betaproteobacteria bacterium TMED22]|tara:strand:+ start:6861 stop:7805 length:945 start_codon:yes stop_codon:yes gene_type:complete
MNTKIIRETGVEKTAKNPVKIKSAEPIKKPDWIRIKLHTSPKFQDVKAKLRKSSLHTVCEEATCPNIGECFSKGTATFMILGDLCTRRCPFCDVAHGRPNGVDEAEPERLASTIRDMDLKYVVITSVDRDDLRDGGATHFAECIKAIRSASPNIKVEILTPDFRGRLDNAIELLSSQLPDVMNHNLETVPRLYKQARPGADYQHSLDLLHKFKKINPQVITKSGVMVGLGETDSEIIEVMHDLKKHEIDMVTVGQYLQPTKGHLPVHRYVHPDQFRQFETIGLSIGFKHVASGPLVRSSYHADEQAGTSLTENY